MKLENNIPAFPRTFDVDIDNINDGSYPQNGMTLLDYFAGKAMQGICSSLSTDDSWKTFCTMSEMKFNESGKDAIVRQSYSISSAMLEERKKYTEPSQTDTTNDNTPETYSANT